MDEELQLELLCESKTVFQIARKLGRTRFSIVEKMKVLKLKGYLGYSLNKAVARTGYTKKQIVDARDALGQRWIKHGPWFVISDDQLKKIGEWLKDFRTREKYFWSKVNKTSSCWLWTGTDNILELGKNYRPAAYSWSLISKDRRLFGDREYRVMHTCENYKQSRKEGFCSCVNPDHLQVVKRGEAVIARAKFKYHGKHTKYQRKVWLSGWRDRVKGAVDECK